MNAKSYFAGAAVCAIAGALMSTACDAQRYGNGPQYSTPAEQVQTRQLNEQAISGTTQSPAVLNGEAPSDQSGGYGAASGADQSSGYESAPGYSSEQSPAAGNAPSSGGYYGEPSSSYGDQQPGGAPNQNYGNPPNTAPGYYAQPGTGYGNPPNNSPGYYARPPSNYDNPPAKYYEPPPSNYGNPQSAYPYGPSPSSDNGLNKSPTYSEQRQPSDAQLRYQNQLSQYRQQQLQYRRDQQRYRGEMSAYDQTMDEWYGPAPYEDYP